MSIKNKQMKHAKMKASSCTRQCGKTGKFLTVDKTGMPCYGKIEKTVGFNPETAPLYETVMDYVNCSDCGLALGHHELVNIEVLDGMCMDCFIEGIEEVPPHRIDNDKSICNHGYMGKAKAGQRHACIQCDSAFQMPQNNLREKSDCADNPKIFLKTDKPRKRKR